MRLLDSTTESMEMNLKLDSTAESMEMNLSKL